MKLSRWAALVGCLLAEIPGGAIYAFSVFSPAVKSTLGLSQTQLALLGLASQVGIFCNVPAGLVQDAFGPRVTMAIGSACHGVGFLLLWLVLDRCVLLVFWRCCRCWC